MMTVKATKPKNAKVSTREVLLVLSVIVLNMFHSQDHLFNIFRKVSPQ